MQIITIILDFLLFSVSALIFSITVLCILLYHRVSDQYIKGFLGVLVPLLILTGLSMINTYIDRTDSVTDTTIYASYTLLATFISIFSQTAILLFLSRYLSDLLPLSKDEKTKSYRIINIVSMLFLILSLFTVFFINRGTWDSALRLVLDKLFLAGSALLATHGIAAIFLLKRAENVEHEILLKWIIGIFLPLIVLVTLDFLFLTEASFKLTYLSYTAFAVNIYLFISRHYIRKYEPEGASKLSQNGFMEESFSAREKEIIDLVIEGKTNKEIGEILYISINTVKTHIKNIYAKLDVNNRIQLIHTLTRSG